MKSPNAASARLVRLFQQFAAVFLVLTLIWTQGGCAKRETYVERGNREQILHLGNHADPTDLDPQIVLSLYDNRILQALFEGLVSQDPATLEFIPGVAESWTRSEDGMVYTFRIRQDARWSNGEPLTAHDFVASYKRICDPLFPTPHRSMFFHFAGVEEYVRGEEKDFSKVGFAAPEAHMLVVTLKYPLPFALSLLAISPFYPVHIPTVEKFGGLTRAGAAWTRPENFVGNGPFTLEEWKPNQVLMVRKNPHYWDSSAVRLNAIRFYPIDNAETEERMFRTGQLHATTFLPVSKVDVYEKEHPGSLMFEPLLNTYFFLLNTARPPLDNPKVRRALSLALDRESLARNVVKGGSEAAFHFLPKNAGGYISPVRLQGTVEEARRLLAEAGFPNGEGLPAIELSYGSPMARQVCEVAQAMWKQNLNINVTIHVAEWKVYLDALKNGSYQIGALGWAASCNDPNDFAEIFVSDNPSNYAMWHHPEYDRIHALSLRTTDQAIRHELLGQLDALILEHTPVAPLFFRKFPYALHPSVKGWGNNALSVRGYKFLHLEPAHR